MGTAALCRPPPAAGGLSSRRSCCFLGWGPGSPGSRRPPRAGSGWEVVRQGVPLPSSLTALSAQKGLRAAYKQGCLFPLPTHVHLKTLSVAGAGSFIAAAAVSQAPPPAPAGSPALALEVGAHAYLSSPSIPAGDLTLQGLARGPACGRGAAARPARTGALPAVHLPAASLGCGCRPGTR